MEQTEQERKAAERKAAQRKAVNKYQAAHCTVMSCTMRKDDAEAFKAACAAAETTPNAVFRAAITQFMAAHAPAAGGPAEAQTGPSAPEGQGAPDGPDSRD